MPEGRDRPKTIFERFEELRVDPKIIELREKMKQGEEVYACCDEHRDVLRANFDTNLPEPTEEETQLLEMATSCRECRLIAASVSDDINWLMEE